MTVSEPAAPREIPDVAVRRDDLAGQTYLVRATRDPFDATLLVLCAWTPSSIMGNHQTISFFDGVCYGQVGTERDPEAYDHLPGGSQERIRAFYARRAERALEARAVIRTAYPAVIGREIEDVPLRSRYEIVVRREVVAS